MKLVSGRIENFAEYSQFKSLEDFNNHIQQWMVEYKHEFTKSERVALKRLVRYSAKFFGVANAKISTLLKAINQKAGGFGVSRSTVERMLRKAKTFGILTVKHTFKTKGGKGHNVYVFNTIDVLKKEKLTYCENSENPTESKVEKENFEKETSISLETSKHNNNHLNTKKSSYIQFVPKSLQHFQAFFGKQVKDIYSRVWLSAKKLKVNVDQDLMQKIGFIAMEQLKQYKKANNEITNDDLFKIAYAIGLKQLQQHFESQTDSKVNQSDTSSIHKKAIRTEIVPEWLNKSTDHIEEQSKKTTVSEEQKKAIWEQVQALNVK